jgi:hypothetical protein
MKNYGRSSVSKFLGDRMVYRSLAPYDPGLPDLETIRPKIGLASGIIPRKNEAEYAQVIIALLEEARRQDASHGRIERLVFIGDTRLLDGTAYANLCKISGWPGRAFIGSETSEPAAVKMGAADHGEPLYLANRWAALADFDDYCAAQGLPVGDGTAVIIDMDKTAVGARGRNGGVIDQARVQAVQMTVAGLLGAAFDAAAFRAAYDPLNQPEFHSFTADNQDFLAYICLILGSGLYRLSELIAEVQSGQMVSFSQFITQVDARRSELAPALQEIHSEIYTSFRAGDPTPFKTFRRNEYLLTVRRFGCLGDVAPLEKLLAEEIVITQEVQAMALEWRQRGALIFGLSDKPDEASIPTPELAAQGFLPLHRAETHAIGS